MAQIFSNDVEAADALKQAYQNLKNEIAKVVVGQDEGCGGGHNGEAEHLERVN